MLALILERTQRRKFSAAMHDTFNARKGRYSISSIALVWIIGLVFTLVVGTAIWLVHEHCIRPYFGLAYDVSTAVSKWRTFNLHPLFMVIGFGFFGPVAATAFKLLPTNHDNAKMIHGVLHLLALSCASFGLWCVRYFKLSLHIDEWYSTHAWLGLGAFILYWAQWALGFLSFIVARYTSPEGTAALRAAVVGPHRILGFCFWSMTAITIITGFFDRLDIYKGQPGFLGVRDSAFLLGNSMALVTLVLLWSVYTVLHHIPKRSPQGSLEETSLINSNE